MLKLCIYVPFTSLQKCLNTRWSVVPTLHWMRSQGILRHSSETMAHGQETMTCLHCNVIVAIGQHILWLVLQLLNTFSNS